MKKPLSLPIGLKVALPALAVISLTAWLLWRWTTGAAERIVFDHEYLDIADDTRLRAREVLAGIEVLRDDACDLARTLGDAGDAPESERRGRIREGLDAWVRASHA
jgi:hypothetical protein